jgi:hypothetical protein
LSIRQKELMAEASTVYLEVSSELASVYLGQEQVVAEAAPSISRHNRNVLCCTSNRKSWWLI